MTVPVAVGVCLSKILITTLAIFDTETVLQQTLTWISLFCDVLITRLYIFLKNSFFLGLLVLTAVL